MGTSLSFPSTLVSTDDSVIDLLGLFLRHWKQSYELNRLLEKLVIFFS